MRGDRNQILLILSGLIVAALIGGFLYREIFPEYKIYQKDYVALEEFRATYTHQSLPPFQYGIKQIVLEREDKGPPVIDRCTSCHVALQIPYFSPTKIASDSSGTILRDQNGFPLKVPNENYIWQKLDIKIASLRDEKVQAQLTKKEAAQHLELAAKYESLKTAHVGEYTYDVTKVLSMHPLMGNETYPFEFHPIEEYGCTSCHNGNGRGLTTDKAHGPVFDGQYEIEHMGHTPHFIESDPQNDPKFSHIFNHKPGEKLIFQTEPIYVGGLIQAKCVQCHQTTHFQTLLGAKPAQEPTETERKSSIDKLTLDYKRGMELYISQACYACHRIADFSRGGVGPELTLAGENYPWYLKRKLSWPQGDLPSSTMPNMHFDQSELESLMTFLLAQKGGNSSISKTAYKAAVTAWEAGKKKQWETPVLPAKVYDLPSSMTIFATEGCAACHRLQGFESNVGFAVEKDPNSNQLYEEQRWFRKLFPEVVHISQYDEELPGSEIVSHLEKHGEEIDKRIVSDVRSNSLLEEIDQKFPGVIESYYSPFHYASRAKDDHYKSLIEKETDSAKVEELNKEWTAWKERVRRVLMTYIQVYGLGRLIGPHLNWSGIYRTDAWLMEHFRSPSGHVPRSIMPVFPFDDTKFYALTYMLDQLGVHNRNALRKVWDEHSFDPSEVYDMLCAQCHGIDRVGNGAIAEWIYPIPKNLRNPEFLRNLTKENAKYSIMHGVKGTPMPPWGEVAPNKLKTVEKLSQGIPVMKENEINYLVNWLFSNLPGGAVIRQSTDVLKWQYSPEDVLEELKKEGKKLVPEKKESPLSSIDSVLHSSLIPQMLRTKPKNDITEIFDVIDRKTDAGDKSYFIKKEYYTPQNIEEGKEFFLTNCAVCHGNEADGNSIRAGVMTESKPRILTNLDWIQSRDDLRLLRSIKYGVPGTAMTPWGDLTNSLQRLQLVIFIRSLSLQQERREKLMTATYDAFENGQFMVETARIDNSKEMEELKDHLIILQQQLKASTKEAIKSQDSTKVSFDLYNNVLEIEKKLNSLKEDDQKYLDLQAALKTERTTYFNLGTTLISKDVSDNLFQKYVNLIQLNNNRYSTQDHHLEFHQNEPEIEKFRALRQILIDAFNQEISKQTKPAEVDSYKKLRDKLMKETEETLKLVQKQHQIFQTIKAS